MYKIEKRLTSSSASSGTSPSGGRGGIVEAGGLGVNPSPIIPSVITVALNPGQANATFLMDYTSTTFIKIFNSAIIKLPELFDGESKSINLFNSKLAEMEKQSGCMGSRTNIIMIPDSTRTPINIVTEYGRLTIENIKASMQNFIGHQSRQSHNSVQLFHCLTNSMAEAAHLKIVEK